MAVPSLQNAAELQRIIKETTGDDASVIEVYKIWHYLEKIFLCTSLWRPERIEARVVNQTSLFNE